MRARELLVKGVLVAIAALLVWAIGVSTERAQTSARSEGASPFRSGTLYVASNDGAECYVNGIQIFSKLSDAQQAYQNGWWNYAPPIPPSVLKVGKNVVACQVRNGNRTGGFDAVLEVNGSWVISDPSKPGRSDDDMNVNTRDTNCSGNPVWEYWYQGNQGPPPRDGLNKNWYELDYNTGAAGGWEARNAPLGHTDISLANIDNMFACTQGILSQGNTNAFFRKEFYLPEMVYQCYQVVGFPYKESVDVVDQFSPRDPLGLPVPKRVTIRRPDFLCEPAVKIKVEFEGAAPTSRPIEPPPFPSLKCYKITTEQPFKEKEVVLKTQFGKEVVQVIMPELLCVEAEKIEVDKQKVPPR